MLIIQVLNVSFDELQKDYEISINALIDSGVDLIMIETILIH